jgi:hypothetical protein
MSGIALGVGGDRQRNRERDIGGSCLDGVRARRLSAPAPAPADAGATPMRQYSGFANCAPRAEAAMALADLETTPRRYSRALAKCGRQAAAWSYGHQSTEDRQ